MKIEAKVAEWATASTGDAYGDVYMIYYTVSLAIDNRRHELRGFFLGGWIPAGAHQDIDGSGLADWGSSQPGGWRTCDTDGQESGAIRVSYDDDGQIRVGNGEAAISLTGTRDDADRIERAIEDAISASDIDLDEPDAEPIYDYIDPVDGLDALPIRVGNYMGAGPVLAWEDGPDYAIAPYPTDADIESAISAIRDPLRAIIRHEADALIDPED